MIQKTVSPDMEILSKYGVLPNTPFFDRLNQYLNALRFDYAHPLIWVKEEKKQNNMSETVHTLSLDDLMELEFTHLLEDDKSGEYSWIDMNFKPHFSNKEVMPLESLSLVSEGYIHFKYLRFSDGIFAKNLSTLSFEEEVMMQDSIHKSYVKKFFDEYQFLFLYLERLIPSMIRFAFDKVRYNTRSLYDDNNLMIKSEFK